MRLFLFFSFICAHIQLTYGTANVTRNSKVRQPDHVSVQIQTQKTQLTLVSLICHATPTHFLSLPLSQSSNPVSLPNNLSNVRYKAE